MIVISPALLEAAVGCTPALAKVYAPILPRACNLYEINNGVRLAAFLAQFGHESASFARTTESFDYAADRLAEVFGPQRAAAAMPYARAPGKPADQPALAEAVYGGEWGRRNLGNTEPGDGWRYRGRGAGITGRSNYARVRDLLRQRIADVPDFEAEPEALERPEWIVLAAAADWHVRGCNKMADRGEFDRISKAINLGDTDSPRVPNGNEDRRARWERAKAALASIPQPPAENAASGPPATAPGIPATEWDLQQQPLKEPDMPIPALVAALLPTIIESVPKLGKVFGSGSQVAERNLRAAEIVVETVKSATKAANEQEAVERLRTDPVALQAAQQAISDRWLEIAEAGGGGIEGARKADLAMQASGDIRKSASFWIALLLLPLVYMLVASLIGLLGDAKWSDDVRAGLAGSLISAIVGGLVGYYFGQTTSRNRTPGGPT